MPKFNTIAVVGVGLIGASLAAAFKKSDSNLKILAVDQDKYTIKKAEDLKIIDKGFLEIKDNLKEAELIFIAVPVSKITDIIKEIDSGSDSKQLIVDAGSTKKEVLKKAQKLLEKSSKTFIGAHPMAGSHKSGIDWHDPGLFVGAPFILTPIIDDKPAQTEVNENTFFNKESEIINNLDENKREELLALKELIESIGARIYIISAEEHDRCTALVSHLPHLLSSALVNMLNLGKDNTNMLKLSGSGFRDMTRIAGSSPELWQDIILSNNKNLIDLIEKYIRELEELKVNLEKNDEQKIFDFLAEAAELKKDID
ncbi:MAG: prephenate dehydrogenase/arogenate dehydrogenase family protein [Halanaerobiales bacterium]|nr:prephenate dehydrogenase/arogenate dehydrogenase family protein [Halanaerobiales bacterium]